MARVQRQPEFSTKIQAANSRGCSVLDASLSAIIFHLEERAPQINNYREESLVSLSTESVKSKSN